MKTGRICPKHPELAGQRYTSGTCTACAKAMKAAAHKADPSKNSNRSKAWREKNAAYVKARLRAWNDAHPEAAKGYKLRRRGFTLALFNAALEKQQNLCAICKADLTKLHPARVHADHDHETGAPRGVLCQSCNSGIGFMGDNPERLISAASYLAKPTLTTVTKQ